jgi:hypothetical protein
MKVELLDNGLMIVPETEFEDDFLYGLEIGDVYFKNGVTAADHLGLKITAKRKKYGVD